MTTRGGAPVASSAGPIAASDVAPMPRSTALAEGERVDGDVLHREHEVEVVDRAGHEVEEPARHPESRAARPAAVPTAPIASASPITSAKTSAARHAEGPQRCR